MPSKQPEPIAIVGTACRFPGGANSPSALWKLLQVPRDVSVDISSHRFDTTGFYHPNGKHHGAANVQQAYLIEEDIRVFDAAFFNISPNEADSMDPQQRLLLETVYEALEAGGHTLESLRGSDTAVFTGTMDVDYNTTSMRDLNTVPTYLATGINRAIISNRVSYFFDWHGPSMTIDTACSSSLIAVHQGVKALRTGESRVALACGTNIILNPETFILESKLQMLSPTGRSRMWDADADGYARGEGVAAVVLKRLSDAIADGDHIECIVRETGTNQDGHSNGITVPSTEAQTALIRETYLRAGLDPENNPNDHPQFFEAHGTGTKAGDPKEADAIYRSFGQYKASTSTPLYVGSIKTVIGHLEGSAGLAGVLKASASIQNGTIAPNLLFNRLNPDLEKFYRGIRVATELMPWPELSQGVPRRASVNSFGFGGSNAHAILEQYCKVPASVTDAVSSHRPQTSTLFIFSAASEISLVAQLRAYSDHLTAHPDIDIVDLAWTLQARRSHLAFKVAFSASSIEQLTSKIDAKLALVNQQANATIGVRTSTKPSTIKPHILGIFTGQGAQWPAMGAELIRSSQFVLKRVQEMEESLATLPESDRPEWSLEGEMLKGKDSSRIGEAALSQPLCTAVQVVLVDLLKASGVTFSAVVGHSSGEIAAAYAAGFVSAHDAIRLAYLRGRVARHANNGDASQKGAMLAVGTSWDDAEDVISLPEFQGRVSLAANNSSASVTLSGDADAIAHVQTIFEEEKKFARMLKVDTAYHSHHMFPCAEPYMAAMRACNIEINQHLDQSSNSCTWFSSVFPSEKGMEPIDGLKDVYWKDNMTSAVLFAEAVRNAVASDDQISLVLEVGPHPALKGPAVQNITDIRSTPLPYSGLLSRGADDVGAFADALGFLWTQLGSQSVDFQSYTKAFNGKSLQPKLVVGLPLYQWSHARSHWSESRRSRRLLRKKAGPHELLGSLDPDSTAHDLRWSNVLKISEIPWLSGHQLQGQIVFPAAGYIAMAMEGSRIFAADKSVKLFELHNLNLIKAMTFDEGENYGVETLVTLTDARHHADGTATANFSCYSLPVAVSGTEQDLEVMATAAVRVVFGTASVDTLSSAPVEDYNMNPVDSDRLYSSLATLGYNYSGPFRTFSSMKRRLGHAVGVLGSYPYTEADTNVYLVHPSTLDVAFHAGMLAYSAPGDNRLWSLHIPTSIRTIRLNPEACALQDVSGGPVPVYATIDDTSEFISTSIDLSADGQHCMIQVEDLTLKAFAPATAAADCMIFTKVKLGSAEPDGSAVAEGVHPTARETEVALACERLAYYYIRKWDTELTDEEWANGLPHHKYLRAWMKRTLLAVAGGNHATVKREWIKDSAEDIKALVASFPDDVDIKMSSVVGENMLAAVRKETTILEHMVHDNLLNDFYKEGTGFRRYNQFLGSMMKQITHRYPNNKIFEIGAGTGGATKAVLGEIGNSMSSYTYTDISLAFFGKAAEMFKEHSEKMTFKVFDAEKTPASQGFEEHSYDIVVASNVLHATESLHNTLVNTRKLLKPGGYLLLLEVTDNEPIRTTFALGPISGWWLGVDDGRKWAPTITPGEWHMALRKAGFGGVDAVTPKIDRLTWPFSVMASQAIDDRVQFLRRPLSSPNKSSIQIESLVILGGRSLESARIAEELVDHLEPFYGEVTILDDLPSEEEALDLPPMSTFINLVDIDSPIFKDMTSEKMEGLKRMLELSKNLLWITQSALTDEPYHNASITFGRTVRREAGHISFNQLDITSLQQDNTPKFIAAHLLQLCALDEWETSVGDSGNKQLNQLLWSKEPEAYLDSNKLSIPRLLHSADQNARLNSLRRVINKGVSIAAPNVAVLPPNMGTPASLVEAVSLRPAQCQQDILVKVESSSPMALLVSAETFLFLAVGKDTTGAQVATFSTVNSRETLPVAVAVLAVSLNTNSKNNTPKSAEGLLIAITSELLAESLLDIVTGGHLLVYCSGNDRFLAAALSRQTTSKATRVTFVCDADEKEHLQDPAWIKLSASAPGHVTRSTMRLLKPTHFLDLTSAYSNGESSQLGLRITEALPLGCKKIEVSSLFRHESSLPVSYDQELLVSRLQDVISEAALSAATQSGSQEQLKELIIPLDQVRDPDTRYHTTSAIHWPLEGPNISVEVRPLDARGFFLKDKTYLLVGLTGKIGQSLAEWMVSNGAGCVCLTSRRPEIDERWMKSVQAGGATVKVLSMDVTDIHSVESVVRNIRATCPPIAGVANGAMVLKDTLFSKMSAETMQQVLTPKIVGSSHLDQVFHDDKLDFFVLFSSAVCVFGNVGQSNYSAANGYINGLVRQRRRRGVVASAFDIGQVAGIGYIESAGRNIVLDQLAAVGMDRMSESDLRLAFAETIRAGHPDPVNDKNCIPEAVLTTGIRCFSDDERLTGPWFTNPMFSHRVIQSRVEESESEQQGKKISLPAARQLVKATSKEEALEILKECFETKLRVVLQLLDQVIDRNIPLVELGIDSLVAVEVRTWFLKEVKVDIPILKVIGGGSLTELCEIALEKLPEQLLAGIGKQDSQFVKPQSESKPELRASPLPAVLQSNASSDDDTTPAGSSGAQSLISRSDSSSDLVTEASTRSASPSKDPLESIKVNTQPTHSFSPQMLISAPVRPARAPKRFLKSVPISLAQSRFWFLQQLLENQGTHNIAYYYHITGDLNTNDLEKAVRIVTSRHESLRTCFIPDETNPAQAYQKVMPSSPIHLECKTIDSESEISVELERLRTEDLDLASGELFRLVLLTLSPSSHYLLMYHHHIIMDGVSLEVFLSDLEKAYTGESLGPRPLQYPEFSTAQRRAYENGEMSKEMKFWKDVFPDGDQPPILPLLPMSRTGSRIAMREFDTHQVQHVLDPALAARIRVVSKGFGSTPFHFYLAAFKSMLFCFTDTDDLTIGLADAARNEDAMMGSIGFFLNLLTLRFRRHQDQPFSDAIVEARKTAYAALENSRLPFDVLLTELNIDRSATHAPFFQAFLDYRQGLQPRRPFGDCVFEMQEEVHTGKTAYDVSADITDSEDITMIFFRAQKSLYDLTATDLLCQTYIHFLDTLTRDPSLTLKTIPLFSESQRQIGTNIGRGPMLISSWPQTLSLRIDQVAKENPHKIALMDGIGEALTYSGMISRIEAIAEALLRACVQAGQRVLVFQTSSSDWPCSMLAIMRIGATYVPLDLRNPIQRLAAVAVDCEPSAILADSVTLDDVPQLCVSSAQVVNVSKLASSASAPIANVSQAGAMAAILYTSGSTGTPKGIMVTHAGLRNEIEGYTKRWELGAERVLQQSAFTFNHSSDQMYTGLVNGGMVYVVPWDKRGSPIEITDILVQHQITYTKATPSEYSMWIQYGKENLQQAKAWRCAFGGGEPLTTAMTQKFADLNLPQLRVFNSYGPTEISISSTKMEIPYREKATLESMSRIPCGFSLPNYFTYAVDEQLRPLPVGMPGELCIGGAGVSLGYLKNQELTSKSFVSNPFATHEDIANGWTCMYRTGDLGHINDHGAMVFHNRMDGDTQVKIRGLRIELSDIESNLVSAAEGALQDAVVTLREGDPEFLVAHVIFAAQNSVTDKKSFLEQLLNNLPVPQYMIPVIAIPLDEFPLTSHSKVDRKAIKLLPLPKRSIYNAHGEDADLSETAVQLRNLWQDVLGQSIKDLGFNIVSTTSFFVVGGSSLLIIQLQSQIQEVFNVALSLVDLLVSHTLGQMARKIDETPSFNLVDWDHETAVPIVPDFLKDIPSGPVSGLNASKTLLITGATGFLARHLLPLLAARFDISKIHCLAVRNPSKLPANISPKIILHPGDLSSPLLGLSEDSFHALASEADVILHLGAARSFWDNFHVLRPSNVHPTFELVKLAAPRRVPIHYISTAGVLGPEAQDNTAAAVSAANHPPPVDGTDGYVASRWASERILERSAAELGIPVSIYRFLPADAAGGGGGGVPVEVLDEFLRLVDETRCVPDARGMTGRLDLIPTPRVAGWLLDAALADGDNKGASSSYNTSFTHLKSSVTVPGLELAAHVEAQRSDSLDGFEQIPFLKWVGRIKGAGFGYFLSSFEFAIERGGADGKGLVGEGVRLQR